MARTGMDHNLTRQAEFNSEGQANESYGKAQGDVGQYRQNIETLKAGKQVGANPWQNPNYLAKVNQLQAGGLDAENNSADAQLRANNRRTGGMNNTSTQGAIRDIALQKMRLGDQLSAERSAGDWNKNVSYQNELARAPLAAAGAEEGLYGTSAGLTGSLNRDLTQYGTLQLQHQYKMYDQALEAAKAAASGAASGAGGGGGLTAG